MAQLLYLSLVVAAASSVVTSSRVVTTFRPSMSARLQNFHFDNRTGDLYIGAVNHVFRVSGDLSPKGTVITGPKDDNLDCPPDPNQPCCALGTNSCRAHRTPTDAVNKLLALHQPTDTLIACSTLFYGSCEKISLRNFQSVAYVYRSVVSNDPSLPDVGFIGKGLSSQGALYVASTMSLLGETAYRNKLPLLATRAVTSLGLSHPESSIEMVVRKSVFFKHGFQYEGFNYFLAVRDTPGSRLNMTVIVRVCQDDMNYNSYMEIPIKCERGITVFDSVVSATVGRYGSTLGGTMGPGIGGDVLYATFIQDRTGRSAICSYSMTVIEQQFEHTLGNCFAGKTEVAHIGPSHIAQNRACVRQSVDVSQDYCGEYNINNPIEGKINIQPETYVRVEGHRLTSIKVKVVDEHTIAFVGTEAGQLLKIHIQTSRIGKVYDAVDLEAGGIYPHGMVLDNHQRHLYVLTPSKVLKVEVSACEQHDTCEACVQAGDPHCGWCHSKSRCSYRDECPTTPLFTWLAPSETCPSINSVEPNKIQQSRFNQRPVEMEVDKFPRQAADQIICILKEVNATTSSQQAASVIQITNTGGATIRCDHFKEIDAIPLGRDHVNFTLTIQVAGSVWANTIIAAYDCAGLTSCIACADSTMPCNWCVRQHACTTATDGCNSDDVIVKPATMTRTVLPTPYPILIGKESCPQWNKPFRAELVAPASISRAFTVRAFNLQSFHEDLQCRFSTPAQTIVSQAQKSPASAGNVYDVRCDNRVLTYVGPKPFELVPLDVMWDNYPIDNPNRVEIKVYKCAYLASSCGECLLLGETFECGWCETGCSLESDCPSTWLDRSAICGNPRITDFTPSGGPVNGKTNVTVTGINLGKTSADLEGRVFLGDVPCNILPELYNPASSFTCTAASASRAGPVNIKLSVAGRYNTTSTSQYMFRDPIVSGFTPQQGPVSGGTLITISGSNLHLGNSMVFTLNGTPAEIVSRESGTAVVRSPSQWSAARVRVVMHVDTVVEAILKDNFHYMADPIVKDVTPLSSVYSGGIELTVTGRNLNVIQKPKVFVTLGPPTFVSEAECIPVTSTKIYCPAPNIMGFVNRPSPNPAKVIQIVGPLGFIMDNADGVVNSSQQALIMNYFPDPKVYPFSGADKTRNYDNSQDMELAGEDMDVINSFLDVVTIQVGGSPCPIKTVTAVRVTCTAPKKPRNISKNLAHVELILGNYRADIGHLKYSGGAKISVGGIVAIVVVVIALLVIIVAVVIAVKRKRHKEAVKKLEVMPRPDSIPNAYYERGQSGGEDGATGGRPEEIPLKSAEEGGEHMEGPSDGSEKSTWKDMLARIENPKIRESVKEVMISNDRLETNELVGQGHFSCVYAGKLYDLAKEQSEKVAVKTLLSSDFDSHSVENFLKEGVIMKNFNHPHVLRLLGVVVGDNDLPMVVLPFMDHGDLRTYVKDKKKNFTARQLLSLAQQVAEGMAYLVSMNCVHRDLAARNCMIDQNNVVKVADFGLTRDLYERDYYSSKDRKAKLPIKWMALESLEDFVFTTRTDIWSYGVLMWELMTRGVTPYPDVDVFDIRNYLASGRRLRKPKYCPDNVYKIMLDCWHEYPERRPLFADLVNRLEILLNPPKKRLPEPEPEPMYMNINKSDSAEYLNPITPPTEDLVSPPPLDADGAEC